MSKSEMCGLMVVLVGALVSGCAGNTQLVGSDGSTWGFTNTAGGATGSVSRGTSTTFSDLVVQSDDPAVCLPLALPFDAQGKSNCRLTIARKASSCGCTEPGLEPADEALTQFVRRQLKPEGQCEQSVSGDCSDFCVCVITPASGESLSECQTAAEPPSDTVGWCYVSDQGGDAQAALVASCREGNKQRLRFFGDAVRASDAVTTIVCVDNAPSVPPAELGQTCVTSNEFDPGFRGYSAKDVSVDTDSPQCNTGVCLANHFQGRVSCPYGSSSGPCLLPGSSFPVSVQVAPQIQERQASVASICSCRCDGGGPGPFCTCPDSMQCEHLIDDVGLGTTQLAGSYCIPKGSQYDVGQNTQCYPLQQSCGPAHPY